LRFKVSDLMITVLPEQGKAAAGLAACCTGSLPASCGTAGQTICTGCTGTCQPCTYNASGCCAATIPASCGYGTCGGASVCGGPSLCTGASVCITASGCGCTYDAFSCGVTFKTLEPIQPEQPLEALTALKGQLQQALDQVQRREAEMTESMKPQTLEQAEELEKKLSAALDEVRAQRDSLKKKR
jgi:hypothetical protein